MFLFGGWRRQLKSSLAGKSFIDAVDLLEIKYVRENIDWSMLLEICSIIDRNIDSAEKIVLLLEDWKVNEKYPLGIIKTALRRSTYSALCTVSMNEAKVASMLMSERDFVTYFYQRAFQNDGDLDYIIFNIFPPIGNGNHFPKMDQSKRQILLDALVDKCSSRERFIQLFRDFCDQNPYFYLYPEVLYR
jgi:hypothetical protein